MHQKNDFDDFLTDLNSIFEDTVGKENTGNLSGELNDFSFDSIFEDYFNESAEHNENIVKCDEIADIPEKTDTDDSEIVDITAESEPSVNANTTTVDQIKDPKFEAYVRAQEEYNQELIERRNSSLMKMNSGNVNPIDSMENIDNEIENSADITEEEQNKRNNQQVVFSEKSSEKKKKHLVKKGKRTKRENEAEAKLIISDNDDKNAMQNDDKFQIDNLHLESEQVGEQNDIQPIHAKHIPLVLRILLLLIEAILIIALALYSVMFVLVKGPSDTTRRLFVKSVRETSAIGFLANIYLSDEEIEEIDSSDISEQAISMDTSLIKINTEDLKTDGTADAWGIVDEDRDGIVIEEVHGNTFNGYMMIVYDPSRVIMGCDPNSFGIAGYTLEQMVEKFDAVGGINGGGFVDLNGTGNGETPSTATVFKGQKYYSNSSSISGFAGIDSNHILHVDISSPDDIDKYDIRYGCGYGPVLVVNGEVHIGESWESGLNPRTVIGQRSDGAILLLVIDGRHVASLGASFEDAAKVMINYGAVNACNMDGGSSSLMYYQSDYVNNKAFVIGVRPIPTTWLVLKEGTQDEYYN